MAELDMLQWNQLAAALASVSKRFARNNPSQAGFADAMLKSAQSNILVEEQKKEKKKQEKAEKGAMGGAIGGLLGLPFGIVGGAAGSALGSVVAGGKPTAEGVISSGIAGGMAGLSSIGTLPKAAAGLAPAAALSTSMPGRTAGDLANQKYAQTGFLPSLGNGGDVTPVAPGFTANQAKAQMAPPERPATSPFAANHPMFAQNNPGVTRVLGGIQNAFTARVNPMNFFSQQATGEYTAPNGYEKPFVTVRRGRLVKSPTRPGVSMYIPEEGGY